MSLVFMSPGAVVSCDTPGCDEESVDAWIHESNLIEGVDDLKEDAQSLRAWRWLCGHRTLDANDVLGLHRRLMWTFHRAIGGTLRTCRIFVGNHEGSSPQEVTHDFQIWCRRVNSLLTWPEIQAAHVAFERIHPFEDGNGRTGRMLMNWQRGRIGLDPLYLKASEREDYYRWFRT